jgi:hypothetical protein
MIGAGAVVKYPLQLGGSASDDGLLFLVNTSCILRLSGVGDYDSGLSMTADHAYGFGMAYTRATSARFALHNYHTGARSTATISGALTPPNGSGSSLGALVGGGLEYTKPIVRLALYRRALSMNSLDQLNAEPYVMFRPIVRRRYFVPAVVAETINIPRATVILDSRHRAASY